MKIGVFIQMKLGNASNDIEEVLKDRSLECRVIDLFILYIMVANQAGQAGHFCQCGWQYGVVVLVTCFYTLRDAYRL
jgi:hypothetical protein